MYAVLTTVMQAKVYDFQQEIFMNYTPNLFIVSQHFNRKSITNTKHSPVRKSRCKLLNRFVKLIQFFGFLQEIYAIPWQEQASDMS